MTYTFVRNDAGILYGVTTDQGLLVPFTINDEPNTTEDFKQYEMWLAQGNFPNMPITDEPPVDLVNADSTTT